MSEIIGILGGSFNPVHIGHLLVASYLQQFTDLSAVWLTLSPLNPLKAHSTELIPDLQRLEMLHIATDSVPGIGVCDLELSLPRPSYTINTLEALRKRYPRKEFRLIIGSDNWEIFTQWRAHQQIIDEYGVIVYPRPGYPMPTFTDHRVEAAPRAPMTSLSSTLIRRGTAMGKDMNLFLPVGVWDYIKEHKLYLPK